MSERIGYVVAVINQASNEVEDTLASEVLHFDLADADWERDLHADEAKQAGRRDRYIVCRLTEVSEDEDR